MRFFFVVLTAAFVASTGIQANKMNKLSNKLNDVNYNVEVLKKELTKSSNERHNEYVAVMNFLKMFD